MIVGTVKKSIPREFETWDAVADIVPSAEPYLDASVLVKRYRAEESSG